MALETSNPHVTPFRLIDHAASGTSNYTTGGTDLGPVLSHAVVGRQLETELVYKQTAGRNPVDVRPLGVVETVEVVLANRSSNVLKLIHPWHWAATNSGLLIAGNQVGWGRRAKANGKTTRLQIAPMNDDLSARITTRPHTFYPYVFCIDSGPRQYNLHGKFLDATVLTLLALWDTSAGTNSYEGDPADFPALT